MVNGNVTKKTCDEACGNDCCTGYHGACDGFTGKVCRDEISCMGNHACEDATIDHVINSCNGHAACRYMSWEDSCDGKSCQNMVGDEEGSSVGNIKRSCHGAYACEYVVGAFGSVGDITKSCNGIKACYTLSYKGTAGNIDRSCNGDFACYLLSYQGTVGNIDRSCNGDNSDGGASNNTGDEGGGVCCRADVGGVCSHVGKSGSVGDIEDSCHGDGACYKVSVSRRSSVGNIKILCKGENALAKAFNDGILPPGALNECCNKNCGCLELQTVPPTYCGDAVSRLFFFIFISYRVCLSSPFSQHSQITN